MALSGCGQPVCVAGIGDCKGYTNTAGQANPPGTGAGRPGGVASGTGLPANPRTPILLCGMTGGKCWVEAGKAIELIPIVGSAGAGGTPRVSVTVAGTSQTVNPTNNKWLWTPDASMENGTVTATVTVNDVSGPLSSLPIQVVRANTANQL